MFLDSSLCGTLPKFFLASRRSLSNSPEAGLRQKPKQVNSAQVADNEQII